MINFSKGKRSFLSVALIWGLFLLSACGPIQPTDFPVTDKSQEKLPENVTIVRLSPQNISKHRGVWSGIGSGGRLSSSIASWKYRIGVGDVLNVIVWDHPELTLPAGPEGGQLAAGIIVKANGNIFYPYVKEISALGRSVSDVQQDLTKRLAEFIPDPQVEVKVVQFNSQKVVVTGAVAKPGTQKISNLPLTLIEAVNGSGGLKPEADSRRVSIQRHGQRYYLDLRALLEQGRAGYNPVLRGGDIVNVPTLSGNKAFILGQVKKPGSVDLGLKGINLTEAITAQGGLNEERANPKGIFVFRAKPKRAGYTVYQLDATSPLAFVLGTEFILHPQDVVYVVPDPAAKWNDLIATLIPTLSAIRGVQVIAKDK